MRSVMRLLVFRKIVKWNEKKKEKSKPIRSESNKDAESVPVYKLFVSGE